MFISSLLSKINIQEVKPFQPKPHFDIKMRPELASDVFEPSKRALPKFETIEIQNATPEDYKNFKEKCDEIKKLRFEKYGDDDALPEPVEVSRPKIKAVADVQFESLEYTSVMKKLKSGEPLSEKEKAFYDFVLSQMEPSEEDRTLWRVVTPYDGMADEINSGTYELKLLNSTNAKYDDFFDFWTSPLTAVKDGVKSCKMPVLLKINVKKGTKMLDCNATRKGKFARMRSEVILPPSRCRVDKIDNELGVVEMTLQNTVFD